MASNTQTTYLSPPPVQKGFFSRILSPHVGASSGEHHLSMCARAGTRARLRSKQGLLATLVERCRDGNAYTRARTLQTWAALAEAAALPLGHWVCVTQLAAGAPYLPTLTSASAQGVNCFPVIDKTFLGHWVCVTELAAGAPQPPKRHIHMHARCGSRDAGNKSFLCWLDMCRPLAAREQASGALCAAWYMTQPACVEPAACPQSQTCSRAQGAISGARCAVCMRRAAGGQVVHCAEGGAAAAGCPAAVQPLRRRAA